MTDHIKAASPAVIEAGIAALAACFNGDTPLYPRDEIVARVQFAMEAAARREARASLRMPPGAAVHHIDGNPLNNAPENLRVVLATENARWS